jgi:hypothetical protein
MQEDLDLIWSASFAISRCGRFLHQVKSVTADPQQEARGGFICTDYRDRFWICKWIQLQYTTISVLPVRCGSFCVSTQNNISIPIWRKLIPYKALSCNLGLYWVGCRAHRRNLFHVTVVSSWMKHVNKNNFLLCVRQKNISQIDFQ